MTQTLTKPNIVPAGAHVMTAPGMWTGKQAHLIGTVVAPGLAADELRVFALICRQTGLDPFRKQIYAWKDKGKLTVHVSIQGMRAIATRSAEYLGQIGPHWCGADGVWQDVWLADEAPKACRVGVRRAGFPEPLYATVTFKEFSRLGINGKKTPWDEKPAHMLAVRAEGHALQRAFPEAYERGFDVESVEGAGANVTVSVVDDSEMPDLPQIVEGAEGQEAEAEVMFEGEQVPPAEDVTPPDVRNERTTAEGPTDFLPASGDAGALKRWYAGFSDAVMERGLGPQDVEAVIGAKESAENVVAYLRAQAMTVPQLLARAVANREQAGG